MNARRGEQRRGVMSWKGGNTRAVIQDLFGINTHSLMLAATGMHVGKTTLSLGVFRGLEKKWGHGRVAYCKPLGQRYKDVMLPDGRTIKVRVRLRKGAVAHAAALCVCVCVCKCVFECECVCARVVPRPLVFDVGCAAAS